MTKEEFITQANTKHVNYYDYQNVVIKSVVDKIKVSCPIHGEYECIARNHLNGSTCRNCSGKEKYSVDKWIELANIKHNNRYDYSLVEYRNANEKINIICPMHGQFTQQARTHLRGAECQKCSKYYSDTQTFINNANKVHYQKYDYSLVKYEGSKKSVTIICPIHGKFNQIPNSHLSGRGCPICKCSKGELDILNYLNNKNVKFIREYRFANCKDKYPLPFDFYIPDLNACIEFDGIQHFRDIKYFNSKPLKSIQRRDTIKNEYCNEKGLSLLRISYKEIKSISDILEKWLRTLNENGCV